MAVLLLLLLLMIRRVRTWQARGQYKLKRGEGQLIFENRNGLPLLFRSQGGFESNPSSALLHAYKRLTIERANCSRPRFSQALQPPHCHWRLQRMMLRIRRQAQST